jgi:hypothetical protein
MKAGIRRPAPSIGAELTSTRVPKHPSAVAKASRTKRAALRQNPDSE